MTARTSDPATSHLAATYIAGKRPGLKDAFLMALKALGPSTANEIADWCVRNGITANAESVRKRALDVVRDGVCEWSDARACKITGLNARTVRLKDGTGEQRIEVGMEEKPAAAAGQQGTGDSRRKGNCNRDSQAVRSQPVASGKDSTRGEVSTLEADRLKAAVEYMNQEREWIEDWRVSLELAHHASGGNWPAGSSEDYQQALTAASSRGLIERNGGKVRRKRIEPEKKVVQIGLFGDEN